MLSGDKQSPGGLCQRLCLFPCKVLEYLPHLIMALSHILIFLVPLSPLPVLGLHHSFVFPSDGITCPSFLSDWFILILLDSVQCRLS